MCNNYLINHRKLPIILIPVRKCKGDNVITRIGDVELDAVGGNAGISLYISARGGGNLYVNLAKVFGEDNR